jgi:hypothetical protein
MEIITAVIMMAAVSGAPATGGQDPQEKSKATLLAFEHYEQVRLALANDKMADVASPAKALVPAAEVIGGAKAKAAAEQLAVAKNIEDARKHFGELSDVLVPFFQAESIEGVHAFMCAMKNRPWVQRGEKVENPYYGKAMLTCGSALPVKR